MFTSSITDLIVVKPGDDTKRVAMYKNGHLRLLMNLIGFKREGAEDDPEATWIVPSALSADQLKQSLDLIKKFEFSPPVFDDGKEAADFIRRKSAGSGARRREVFDDEDDDNDDDEELLFEPGGPTNMKKSDALDALKKKRRRRREGTDDEPRGLTDEQLKARNDARRARELEKNRKIKSELMVQSDDEDWDEETDKAFFEAEEKRHQQNKINIMKTLLGVSKEKEASTSGTSLKKRQSSAIPGDDSDEEMVLPSSKKRQSRAISIDSDNDEEEEDASLNARSSSTARDDSDEETRGTPISSPHVKSSQAKRRKVSGDDELASPKVSFTGKENQPPADDSDEDEDMPVARPARQRVRSGFIVDSSDEE
jgi:replication fork protection complex subunit Tof1/Swi1